MLRGLLGHVADLLRRGAKLDDDLYEDLEAALIQADVSLDNAADIVRRLRQEARRQGLTEADQLRGLLRERIADLLRRAEAPLQGSAAAPTVFLIVGVNGVGKTTTIAKIAHWYKSNGYKVLLSAADTFRAAAIEQLESWAKRVGCFFVAHKPGADPGAVVHDSIESAKARGAHLVLIDTAGRLHTKKNLMEELRKVRRVCERQLGRPPDETLLVLDATIGQNAIVQARQFKEIVDVTGLILAKMDSTAKGGAVVSIVEELGLPIKLVAVGEGLDDLRLFSAAEMAAEMVEA